eukprot:SAG31_NODE_16375_length_711_cov_1.758170_2_plen_174_part_01
MRGARSADMAARYREDGFAIIHRLLAPTLVNHARREALEVLDGYLLPATTQAQVFLRSYARKGDHRAAGSPDAYPFDRLYNLEERSPFLRRLVTAPAFGRLAAEAMGVPSVRLYMTSLFNKARGDSASQWHKDIDASPFESSTPFLTLWIPLAANDTTRDMGTLEYAAKSHEDE